MILFLFPFFTKTHIAYDSLTSVRLEQSIYLLAELNKVDFGNAVCILVLVLECTHARLYASSTVDAKLLMQKMCSTV